MSRPRNHRPDLNGVLVIDKPLGMSSAAVCALVRRATGGAKVGHAGTLDPLATGVLVLCLGSATREASLIMGGLKRYTTTIDLGALSTTDDLEGEATPVEVATPPTRAGVDAAVATFLGSLMQAPPVYSAVHVNGERAYRTARRAKREGGGIPERPPARPVWIESIDVLAYDWPMLTLDIRCGKGTYIRSLARDLGEALGTGGRLVALRRTEVGPYTADRAIDPRDPDAVAHFERPLPAPGPPAGQ